MADLGGNLRLEAESVFLDFDRLDDSPAENLKASFHVGKVEISQHVGKQGQKPVADAVLEVKHPMRLAANEP